MNERHIKVIHPQPKSSYIRYTELRSALEELTANFLDQNIGKRLDMVSVEEFWVWLNDVLERKERTIKRKHEEG